MTQPVGIVLVSHSRTLASGLAELLGQLAGDTVPIQIAGGTSDGLLGTSYDLIYEAVTKADRGSGVVVLPDLGSSVLTARMVLEEHPELAARMVDAPFVEGAVSAAVTASVGADLTSVVSAAEDARSVRKFSR